jgi:transposase
MSGCDMAGRPAERLELPRKLRRAVVRLARSTKAPFRRVQRAKIVALACDGVSNAEIARIVGCTEVTVRKWRARIERFRKLTALDDADRAGRPARVPVSVRCELIKIACDRPKDDKTPFRQLWTLVSLRDCVAAQTGWRLSTSEVRRILDCEGIRPHHVRMWLHSPDPDFGRKVREVCKLYVAPPPGATVLCVDEKPGMQALERAHPTRYSTRDGAVRYEFEYIRHGTSTLIAAFDTRTGDVYGECRRRTAKGLVAFMEAVARRYPTGQVFIVWDNLNIHHGDRWQEFNARHGGRFHFVYTPLHASWVNQVEIWFSILQRRVLKYGSFRSKDELSRAVRGFIRHWNRLEAHPFRWTFRGRCRSVPREEAA